MLMNQLLYTAITIGPIAKTLDSARSTKAIWSASYLFSWIMKDLVARILAVVKNEEDILMPYIDTKLEHKDLSYESILEKLDFRTQAGLFPDRCIVRGRVAHIDQLKQDVICNLAKKMAGDLKIESSAEIEYFFTQYLTIEILEVEVIGENPVIDLNKLLDTKELNRPIMPKQEYKFLHDFLENTYYNFFIQNEFEAIGDHNRFPSTVEIGCGEFNLKDTEKQNLYRSKFQSYAREHLLNNDDEDSQHMFLKSFREDSAIKNRVRNYQRHIAIVQADGDNMGAFVQSIFDGDADMKVKESLFRDFSKKLLEYTKEAVELIKAYGGVPIYAGGDDLLFFAPIAHTVEKEGKIGVGHHLVKLIADIDGVFDESIAQNPDFQDVISRVGKKPTMSFGVSISYYKYPLNQALTAAAKQLFERAKTGTKNNLAFSVIKHSGQAFGGVLHKGDSGLSFKLFNELLESHLTEESYIHSVVYHIQSMHGVLYAIGNDPDKDKRSAMFKHFFQNNFDESVHLQDRVLNDFLVNVCNLFNAVYLEYPLALTQKEQKNTTNSLQKDGLLRKKHERNMEKIYSILRTVDFILNKEDRDDL